MCRVWAPSRYRRPEEGYRMRDMHGEGGGPRAVALWPRGLLRGLRAAADLE